MDSARKWSDSRTSIIDKIEAGREKLEVAKALLKQDFCGIDNVIDAVFEKIEAWYVMPELISRPLIINLWGMTGVGKTDLVRKLTRYLEFHKSYVEIQLKRGNVGSKTSLMNDLAESAIEFSKPGVLLLDEIQKFRTVDRNHNELSPGPYDDIWMLLSDGSFEAKHDKMRDLEDMVYTLCAEMIREEERAKKTKRGKLEKDEDEDIEDWIDSNDILVEFGSAKIKSKKHIGCSLWEARRMKSNLMLSETAEVIMTWEPKKRLEIIREAMNSHDVYSGEKYSKLLIFISGNLDEAFHQAINVGDCDNDADIAHERTMQIDLTDIKRSLLDRFAPEQIARFGNNHVIYPSLDSKSFRQIISNKLRDEVKDSKKKYGLDIAIGDSVNKVVYENGVFPTQGTRPVFTTLSTVMAMIFPEAFMTAAKNDVSEIHVNYEREAGKFIFLDSTDKVLSTVPFAGDLDKLRDKKKIRVHERRNTSVHEAGHALVFCVLNGVTPSQVLASGITVEGCVQGRMDDSSSPMGIMNEIAIGIAGTVAEELIFGTKMSGRGNRSDIAQTTTFAADLVRRSGVIPDFPALVKSSDDEQLFDSDVKRSDETIRKVMEASRYMCEQILKQYVTSLVEIAEELFVVGYARPEKLVEICSPHFDVVVLDVDVEYMSPYNDIFETFRKTGMAEISPEECYSKEGIYKGILDAVDPIIL